MTESGESHPSADDRPAVGPDMDELRRDVRALRADLQALIDSLHRPDSGEGGPSPDEARSRLRQAARQIGGHIEQHLHGAYEGACQEGEQVVEQTRQCVQTHPLTAVAFAFLGGVALAGLLRRG